MGVLQSSCTLIASFIVKQKKRIVQNPKKTMKKVAIFAIISDEQLEFLRKIAEENNVNAEFVVEEVQNEEVFHPITGEILDVVARNIGKTPMEVALMASQMGISTVEQAIAHKDVPDSIKELLQNFI